MITQVGSKIKAISFFHQFCFSGTTQNSFELSILYRRRNDHFLFWTNSTINSSTSVHNELSLQTALKLGIMNKLFVIILQFHDWVSVIPCCLLSMEESYTLLIHYFLWWNQKHTSMFQMIKSNIQKSFDCTSAYQTKANSHCT